MSHESVVKSMIIQYTTFMQVSSIQVAPSILSSDFTSVIEAVRSIEKSGADWIHLDVMDGHFVPNLTFGPKMVSDIRAITELPLDVHLMVNNPELSAPWYIDAGADHITFHIEACVHTHRLLQYIKQAGLKAGISMVPSTSVASIEPVLDIADIILVMTVNPGFGGQKLIPAAVEKIRTLSEKRASESIDYKIVVDGGVDITTAPAIVAAGADVLVSGSAFFSSTDKKAFVEQLKTF